MKEKITITIDNITYIRIFSNGNTCTGCAGHRNSHICSSSLKYVYGCVDAIWVKLSEYRQKKLEELGI